MRMLDLPWSSLSPLRMMICICLALNYLLMLLVGIAGCGGVVAELSIHQPLSHVPDIDL